MILHYLILLAPAHHQDWVTIAQMHDFLGACSKPLIVLVVIALIWLAVSACRSDSAYRAATDDHFRRQAETINDLKAQLAAKGKD